MRRYRRAARRRQYFRHRRRRHAYACPKRRLPLGSWLPACPADAWAAMLLLIICRQMSPPS